MSRRANITERARSRGRGMSDGDVERLIAEALEAHRAGRLDKARPLYMRILQARPEQPDALHYLGLMAHQLGKHDRAVALIRRAVAGRGSVAVYHLNLGEAYTALGRLDEAIASYRHALSIEPDDADTLFAIANALFDRGDLDEAIACYRRAVALAPNDVEALINLGNALADRGEREEALACYQRAAEAAPDFGHAHLNLGNLLGETGRKAEAIASYRRAIAADPSLAEALVNLGNALHDDPDQAMDCYRRALALRPEMAQALVGVGDIHKLRGESGLAADSYMRAISLKPDYTEALNKLGNALLDLRRYEDARAAYERTIALDPDYAEAYSNIGTALIQLGREREAIPHIERALELKPDLAEAHYNMGVCCQQQGKFDQAVEWYHKAVDLQPDLGAAVLNITLNSEVADAEQEIERVLKLLEAPGLPADDRINLNFALGRLWDQQGDPDAAFACYRTANKLKRPRVRYDREQRERQVNEAIETFSADYFAARQAGGNDSELPVFVVGMPRSGTTLVEQILASHPRVFGAGELDGMRTLVLDLPARLGGGLEYPACATRITPQNAAELAAPYLEYLRGHDAQAERITDKLPLNFMRLGLIAVLMPKARIIHCRRDPLDVSISCFFQNFGRSLHFSYDLADVGHFYRQYERIMAHWQTVLPVPVFEARYEALVADPEPLARQLVDFCGLEWDPRCLAFHEHERPIRTASFRQVRQPLYGTSVGRWRRYEKHLGPLFDALDRRPG